MPPSHSAVRDASHEVLAALADPRYAHTSHLHVRVDATVVVDRHLRGPLGLRSSP